MRKPFFYKVNWHLLFSTLEHRGFNTSWINSLKTFFGGGRIAINRNGSLSNYLECRRGVKQGDPLSPLLFILVADSLSKLIKKSITAGQVLVQIYLTTPKCVICNMQIKLSFFSKTNNNSLIKPNGF
jgi:hypothetical protein